MVSTCGVAVMARIKLASVLVPVAYLGFAENSGRIGDKDNEVRGSERCHGSVRVRNSNTGEIRDEDERDIH